MTEHTAYSLALLWQAWLEHDEEHRCTPRDHPARSCLVRQALFNAATDANAAVIEEYRQYAEDAVRLSGELSAGGRQ